MNNLYQINLLSLFFWIGFLTFLALLSYKAGFLTRNGSIAAIIVGAVIFVTGDNWLYPLILFFILSSILTRISAYYTKTAESGHSARTATQVLANGALPALSAAVYMFYPDPAIIIFFLGSLAAATSDTWSTELGSFSKIQPRLLTSLRKVSKGTSGGITLIGALGGIAGSAALALSGLLIFEGDTGIIAVFAGGITGNLFDSFLGVSLQAKNRCVVCDIVTEKFDHCGETTVHSSGLRLLNNESVNFLCSLTGGLSAVIIWIQFR